MSLCLPEEPGTWPFRESTWDDGETPGGRFGVVGDSLVGQAGPTLAALGAQRTHTVDVWAIAGAAPCDFRGGYAARMQAAAPGRVAFAFIGNATTPCMVSALIAAGAIPAGSTRPPAVLTQAQQDAIVAIYDRDLRAMVDFNEAHGIGSILVLPPPMAPGTWHGQVNTELVNMLNRVGSDYGATVFATGLLRVLLGGTTFRTATLGHPLRHTDGTHLHAPLGTSLYASSLLDVLTEGT